MLAIRTVKSVKPVSLIARIRFVSSLLAVLSLSVFTLAGITTYSIAKQREDLTGRSIELLLTLERTGALFPSLARLVTTPFDPGAETSEAWLERIDQYTVLLVDNLADLGAAATNANIGIDDAWLAGASSHLVDLRAPVEDYETMFHAARAFYAKSRVDLADTRISIQQLFELMDRPDLAAGFITAESHLDAIGMANALDLTKSIETHLEDLWTARTAEEAHAVSSLLQLELRELILQIARLPEGAARSSAAEKVGRLRRALFDADPAPELRRLGAAREQLRSQQNMIFAQFENLRMEITSITRAQKSYIDATGADLTRQTQNFFTLLAVSGVIVLSTGVFFWRGILERQISQRLANLTHAHARLNAGDRAPIHLDGANDELQQLARALEASRLQFIERERLERELFERTEEAIENAAAKSRFLSSMSHEVRTPLNAIMGLFELIENSDAPERQKLRARNGRIAAEGLFAVLSQIVDAGKIEANMMSVELSAQSTQDLKVYLQATLEGSVAKAGKNGSVTTSLDWSSRIPEHLELDTMRLRQILGNLIDNAVRFTDAGRVWIQTDYDTETAEFSLAVSDTGIGIDEKDMSSIFDVFQQLDSGPRRNAGGSGLGLAISKSLAELMNGSLTVRSTSGQGSEFTLRIPARVV